MEYSLPVSPEVMVAQSSSDLLFSNAIGTFLRNTSRPEKWIATSRRSRLDQLKSKSGFVPDGNLNVQVRGQSQPWFLRASAPDASVVQILTRICVDRHRPTLLCQSLFFFDLRRNHMMR